MASNVLLASVVSDIKNYNGKDPLLPWIRGIRKMKDSLSSDCLKEKLPRFLQKCTQTFQSDRRYRNDLRYIRVWLQLMDFVEDPKKVLTTMEANSIGTKHSLFYQAYALYYEKSKKFEEADKMFHLGVQNQAEPLGELEKAYEQFLNRMARHKKQRIQRKERTTNRLLSDKSEENNENGCPIRTEPRPLIESNPTDVSGPKSKQQATVERGADKGKMICGDDTIVAKFVGTTIVGKSEAEDACHHGLVEPTINMKEAMNAINSMFSEPLDTAPVGRSGQRQQKDHGRPNNGFNVFIDENLNQGSKLADTNEEKRFPLMQQSRKENHQPQQEPLSIFIDGEENDEFGNSNHENDPASASHENVFVFPHPKDLQPESSDDMDGEGSPRPKFREDTVVRRFVGSTILDEPEVENVWHHGLVDPTINLKEAMNDINNMFGKPMDFVRARRSKKPDKVPEMKNDFGGFAILPDDDLDNEPVKKPVPKASEKSRGCDLFEPTLVTKEAIDDINKLFGMPLDF
ncbi:hypothetical protein UlMin_044843 [Ulmus minor]